MYVFPSEAVVAKNAITEFSLEEEYLVKIEKLRIDREEIEKIALLREISSSEEIRELDRKLTEFY